ncbi:unnamed protein product [Meloidogyne enterolobii]|uniref:Uncharacterized protein n=1 Tax=Meloidogyne enterolobii TaxID=390850 RepID=A0ACB0XU91_MELEN
MRRCLDIGMLPENVQNKRNKRDYFFADTLNNAIQNKDIQQSPTTMEHQNKLQSLSRTEIDKLLGPHFNKLTELNESQSFTGEAKRSGIALIFSTLCLSSPNCSRLWISRTEKNPGNPSVLWSQQKICLVYIFSRQGFSYVKINGRRRVP